MACSIVSRNNAGVGGARGGKTALEINPGRRSSCWDCFGSQKDKGLVVAGCILVVQLWPCLQIAL